MRPSEVAEVVELLYSKRRPGFVWGPPGAGKSAVMAQTAAKLGIQLWDIRLSMLDPTDLKGFPIADREQNVMRWLPADFLPKDPNAAGIIFFDEANAAPKSVEAPMYQLTHDRRLGDYVLPSAVSIMMAGNREGIDRSIANRQSAALANRLIHIDYEINLDDWVSEMIRSEMPVTELLAFMRFRPELLHKFDSNSKAWPSPRTWVIASDLMRSGLSRDTEFELIKGTVGEGPAGEFQAFMNIYRDLPNIDDIKKSPTKVKVPIGADCLYAITTALAEKTKKDTFEIYMQYIMRMAIEYQVVYIRDCVRRGCPVENTRTFTKWSLDNADVLA